MKIFVIIALVIGTNLALKLGGRRGGNRGDNNDSSLQRRGKTTAYEKKINFESRVYYLKYS